MCSWWENEKNKTKKPNKNNNLMAVTGIFFYEHQGTGNVRYMSIGAGLLPAGDSSFLSDTRHWIVATVVWHLLPPPFPLKNDMNSLINTTESKSEKHSLLCLNILIRCSSSFVQFSGVQLLTTHYKNPFMFIILCKPHYYVYYCYNLLCVYVTMKHSNWFFIALCI